MNEISLVRVSEFTGEPDKNGKAPIFLSLIAGTMPNRMVLSGTIAERSGIKVNEVHMVHFVERAADERYGRQFSVNSLGTVGPLEVQPAKAQLGEPIMVNVDLPTPTAAQPEIEDAVVVEEDKE